MARDHGAPGIDPVGLAAFAAERFGRPNPVLDLTPLRGGLSSPHVVAVGVRDEEGRLVGSFVAKRLVDEREGRVYRDLLGGGGRIAPKLLGMAPAESGGAVLFLDRIRRVSAWPWRDLREARKLLRFVAAVHEALADVAAAERLPPWDYEAELVVSAARTREILADLPRDRDLEAFRRVRPAVNRLAERIPELRRRLLSEASLPAAAIHGDLHPGNVVLRAARGGTQPVLVDWARARIGSPLEDAASLLMALSYWEPNVRRKHDTLLGDYLEARGLPRTPGRAFRRAWWLAGALNALAGALGYHLMAAATAETERVRRDELLTAAGWARIVRRADAQLRP